MDINTEPCCEMKPIKHIMLGIIKGGVRTFDNLLVLNYCVIFVNYVIIISNHFVYTCTCILVCYQCLNIQRAHRRLVCKLYGMSLPSVNKVINLN